jgi:hypothetical protein
MGTKELRLSVSSEPLLKLEELRADLTENLGSFFSVVEVEVGVRSTAAGTDNVGRNL